MGGGVQVDFYSGTRPLFNRDLCTQEGWRRVHEAAGVDHRVPGGGDLLPSRDHLQRRRARLRSQQPRQAAAGPLTQVGGMADGGGGRQVGEGGGRFMGTEKAEEGIKRCPRPPLPLHDGRPPSSFPFFCRKSRRRREGYPRPLPPSGLKGVSHVPPHPIFVPAKPWGEAISANRVVVVASLF